MDALPFVVDVYKRDLTLEHYFIGYLQHPYVSLYTGRGCRSKCTFCLWPQTVGGQRYRTRSVDHVIEEISLARRHFPQVKEFFFDDDTFTDDRPRAEAIARGLGQAGRDVVVQRQGERPLRDAEGPAGTTGSASCSSGTSPATRDPEQHQEGHPARQRAALHPRLPRARHHDPRDLHLRAARGDARRRSRRRSASRATSTRTRSRPRSPRRTRARRSTARRVAEGWLHASDLVDGQGVQRAALSYPAPVQHGDLRLRGDVLQALLLPPAEDLQHRRRDAPRSSDHEATPARGPRVHPLSRKARSGIGPAPPRPAWRAPRSRSRRAGRRGAFAYPRGPDSDGIPKCSR